VFGDTTQKLDSYLAQARKYDKLDDDLASLGFIEKHAVVCLLRLTRLGTQTYSADATERARLSGFWRANDAKQDLLLAHCVWSPGCVNDALLLHNGKFKRDKFTPTSTNATNFNAEDTFNIVELFAHMPKNDRVSEVLELPSKMYDAAFTVCNSDEKADSRLRFVEECMGWFYKKLKFKESKDKFKQQAETMQQQLVSIVESTRSFKQQSVFMDAPDALKVLFAQNECHENSSENVICKQMQRLKREIAAHCDTDTPECTEYLKYIHGQLKDLFV
jgi:hypothetical protein